MVKIQKIQKVLMYEKTNSSLRTINIKEALILENCQIVDTRTPNEFKLDHLPDAVNIPIFSNEERVIIGTLYKQVSKHQAIKEGIKFFSQNLPLIMEQIDNCRENKVNTSVSNSASVDSNASVENRISSKQKTLIIQCWRGGMRSKVLTALLDALNYDVLQLVGGYKSYRAYIRKKLSNYIVNSKLVVIHGLTGTGKTELLKQFDDVINLEELARHRGSSYGAVGLEPNNQKNFENLLWQKLELLNKSGGAGFNGINRSILVEGESKRIGNIVIPEFFWKSMKKGINIEVVRSVEERAKAIVKEYFDTPDKIEKIKEITSGLNKNISKVRRSEVINLFDQDKFVEGVTILLTDYYDPLYSHSLNKITFQGKICTNNLDNAKEDLIKFLS